VKQLAKKTAKTAPKSRVGRREWASKINAAWRKSVAAIFETGRLLIAAKASLEHGSWEAMLGGDLKFNANIARMLMEIGRDRRLAKPQIFVLLPPAYTTIYQVSRLDDEQLKARANDGTIQPNMTGREIVTLIKQTNRAERERTSGLAAPEGKFGVILEDFEWHFEVRSEAGMDRHAANHYETADDAVTPELIVERTRERFECADDDCVLFMNVPGPHLAIGLKVMELRGFIYKSQAIWRKQKIITGYWFRYVHENILVGVKGNVPCPAPGTQWQSVIDAAAGDHSAKPELIHEMIEQYFRTWRKIELNRRGKPRPGWTAWGNEAE
jgi:N6-adenosine-specific RNA methylase IME4